MNGRKILSGVAESAYYNIIVSILFRIQTFLLNGFILHYVAQDVLGIINVRIMLLYMTIMFLSTEAFKNASMADPSRHHWPQVINLLWLTLPTATIVSAILGYIWLVYLEQPSPEYRWQYVAAIWVVGISSMIERIGEPLFIVSGVYLFNKLRAYLMCVLVGIQCGIQAIAVYISPEHAIIGFCVAQMVRCTAGTVFLYIYFGNYVRKSPLDTFHSIWDFLPRRLPNKSLFGEELPQLTFSFFKQGILKQILTEGERYMMTVFNILNFAEQGVYDAVSNLGSIAARFVFRPVEESGFQFFAQTLQRNVPFNQQTSTSVEMGANVLKYLLKAMMYVGLITITFGYAYSYLLLQLYGGETLTSGSGPSLLRWNCFYIFIIAVNGITECFTFATMSKNDIDRFNYIMLFISGAFLGLSWYLTGLFGSVGFILANCANMGLRIAHSCVYILKSFQKTSHSPLFGLLPHPAVLGTMVVSFGIAVTSENLFCCHQGIVPILIHIAIGAVCLLIVVGTIVITEKELVLFVKQMRDKKELGQKHGTDLKED